MNNAIRRRLLAGLLLLGLAGICGCPWLFGRKESLGTPADFSFTTFSGVEGRLSQLKGQPLVLNFWAAWCGPCVGEFPEFQEVVNAHAGQFTLLSVAIDDNNDPQALVKQQAYSWTFASSKDDIATLYAIKAIPLTLFITRDGHIAATQLGGMSKDVFEENLKKIL